MCVFERERVCVCVSVLVCVCVCVCVCVSASFLAILSTSVLKTGTVELGWSIKTSPQNSEWFCPKRKTEALVCVCFNGFPNHQKALPSRHSPLSTLVELFAYPPTLKHTHTHARTHTHTHIHTHTHTHTRTHTIYTHCSNISGWTLTGPAGEVVRQAAAGTAVQLAKALLQAGGPRDARCVGHGWTRMLVFPLILVGSPQRPSGCAVARQSFLNEDLLNTRGAS